MARSESDSTLDAQLCFAVYAASRAVTGAYRDKLARIGLTYTQYVVLLLLWEHRRLPMRRLCEKLRLESATLSPLLKRMASQGLITRERSAADERTVEIGLTEKGAALYGPAEAAQRCVEEATGLDRSRLEDLRDQLRDLTERLHGTRVDTAL
jgi:MarR family transcriptional regulator, organic hydroperoxide resistance regulator